MAPTDTSSVVDGRGGEEPDRRTAGVFIGGVIAFLLLTGAVNSMGGIDALLGGAPSGSEARSSHSDATAGGGQRPTEPGTWFDGGRESRDDDSFADEVHDSGPALTPSQQRFVARVSANYPQYADSEGKIISLAQSVCLRVERGGARPAGIARALIRNGVPEGVSFYVAAVSIRHRCPEHAVQLR